MLPVGQMPAEVSIPAERQSTRLFRKIHHLLQHIVNIQLWDSLADLSGKQNPQQYTNMYALLCVLLIWANPATLKAYPKTVLGV